jgi:hypothetical protein
MHANAIREIVTEFTGKPPAAARDSPERRGLLESRERRDGQFREPKGAWAFVLRARQERTSVRERLARMAQRAGPPGRSRTTGNQSRATCGRALAMRLDFDDRGRGRAA